MLAYFPHLYGDELLYSWFARYHVHSTNVSPKQTMKDLFGKKNTIAVPDLPTELNKVYERITQFNVPSTTNWIKNHTLFRYYTAFSTEDVKKCVLQTMKYGTRPQSIHLLLGIMASSLKENQYFKFCTECFYGDLNEIGEPYWRRSHQAPGVLICLDHNELLLPSLVRVRGNNKHEFVAASSSNCYFKDKTILMNNKLKNHAEALTKQIQQLLERDYYFTTQGMQVAYKYLLNEKGLLSANGSVNQRLLSEQFLLFYGEEFLSLVQSAVDIDNHSCWLKAITRKHRKAFHSIRHILLINFLGESIESFYEYSKHEVLPFGEGPYYCLNPAANHYKQRVIPNVVVTSCYDTRKPVGTFHCDCGFIYSRRGPDTESKDQFKIGRIKQFGTVWQSKLQDLIKKMTITEVSRELRCDIGTVRKYANKQSTSLVKNEDQACNNLVLKEKRSQWLKLLNEEPNEYITYLRKQHPKLYTLLYRKDKEWLKQHSPKRKKNEAVSKRIDWESRDEEMLKEVFLTVSRLKEKSKPVYLNLSRIGKEIGKLSLFEKHLDKLPKTKAYII